MKNRELQVMRFAILLVSWLAILVVLAFAPSDQAWVHALAAGAVLALSLAIATSPARGTRGRAR